MSRQTSQLVIVLAGIGVFLAACSDELGTRGPIEPTVAMAVSGAPQQQDWRQCENGKDFNSICDWITGNLTQTQNTYPEGFFVPKALRIPKLIDNEPLTIVMQYGFLKGGLTTHDFVGRWNQDMVNANPCEDSRYDAFCTGPGIGTLDLSLNPGGVFIDSDFNDMVTESNAAVAAACGVVSAQLVSDMAEAIADAGPENLIIQGVNVQSIEIVDITFDGCSLSGDAEGSLTLEVTPNRASTGLNELLLLFGAHVARSAVWDNGGAAGVTGSPYHLGLSQIDDITIGSMDLQMSAAVVVAPEPAAAIMISPDGTNEVGDPHVITATVTTQADVGEPSLPAPDGTQIDFVIESGPGNLSASSCLTSGGTGSCNVTLNSSVGGVTVASATSTVEVSGVDITVTTDGVAPNSDNLQKTWVDAKIAISPLTELNAVGEAHTFTVTLMKDVGTGTFVAATGETVTATQSGTLAPVTLGGTCVSGTTDANGRCTFTYTSNVAGTLIITASSTLNVGGVSLTRSTDGTGNNSGPATKTWGNAWMTIGTTDTNEVGQPHVFTVMVMRQVGGGAAEAVTGVTVTPTGETGFITEETCTGGTDASGQCTITVNSATPDAATIGASANVPIDGTTIPVSTNETGNSSGPATKTWVDAKITIAADATNQVGQPHIFTVTVMQNAGDGGGFVPAAGETVTAGGSGVGDIDNSFGCLAAGAVTDASGQCQIRVSSNAAGSLQVTASSNVQVGGLSLTRSTDGTGSNSGPATKTWVTARISIAGTGTNRVGTNHTFTVTLEENSGSGFVAASGETVTALKLAGVGSITGGTCTSASTDAIGQCTIVITSNVTGTTMIGASSTVQVGGIGVPAAINSTTSPFGTNNATGPGVKTWVDARISIQADATNPVGEAHTFTVTVMQDAGQGAGFVAADVETVTVTETGVGDLTGGTCTATSLDPPGDPQSGTGVTDVSGQCTAVVNSAVAGSSTVSASSTVSVGGITVAVTTDETGGNSGPATKTWIAPGATLLIIDEDGIDNGLHFNANGGGITPDGPDFFSALGVNDDRPGERQRAVLRYFEQNVGRTITVRTGQTGDEAWFAPNCIPQSLMTGGSKECLEGDARATAIANYFGQNGSSAIPAQSRLDKIPAVMPLRALGLNSLIGRDICAVVYDSDISINYNSSRFPFTDGNLQGETLGIVAFRVNDVRTLNGFSSSTLPEVQITIQSTSTCGTFELFNAPVPTSSSVPNDRVAPGSPNGYRALLTHPGEGLFY